MTQSARVLRMLKDAGSKGVRSDQGYKEFIPRMAARIKDLRDEGHNITSEREGKFVRYRLQEQCGVTSRSTRQHTRSKDTSLNERIENSGPGVGLAGPRTAQREKPGDESEVPAAAPEGVGVGREGGAASALGHSADPGEASPEVHTTGSAPLPGPALEAQASGEAAPSLFPGYEIQEAA